MANHPEGGYTAKNMASNSYRKGLETKLKYNINRYPIIGPIITRPIEEKIALLTEKTFNLVRAIPNDIKIKKIVAYINKKVVFSTNAGNRKS